MAGVFDIDIHDPDMGNNVDLDGNTESDDDVIEVEVSPFFINPPTLLILKFFFLFQQDQLVDQEPFLPPSSYME